MKEDTVRLHYVAYLGLVAIHWRWRSSSRDIGVSIVGRGGGRGRGLGRDTGRWSVGGRGVVRRRRLESMARAYRQGTATTLLVS